MEKEKKAAEGPVGLWPGIFEKDTEVEYVAATSGAPTSHRFVSITWKIITWKTKPIKAATTGYISWVLRQKLLRMKMKKLSESSSCSWH